MQLFKKVTLGNSHHQIAYPQGLGVDNDVFGSKTSQATESLGNHIVKASSGSLLIQIVFAGFAFINSLILARLLGAGGYGAFANAMAWVSVLGVPASFGFGILLVRDIAIYSSQRKWAALNGLLRFSNLFVLVFSVLLALICVMVSSFVFSTPDKEVMRLTLWMATPLVPLHALLSLRESATRGLEHVFRAQFSGMIIRPILLLGGIVAIYLYWSAHFSAPKAMAVNVCASTVSLCAGIFWLGRVLPPEVKKLQPEYKISSWLKAAFPMLIYGGMQIILGQTDIVMLGTMRGAGDVGLYAATNRLAFLVVYVTMASDVIIAPIIARLSSNGESARLQRILTRVVRTAFLIVLPFGLILIFAGRDILVIFGREFMAAQTALAILAVGRLMDVALGNSALVLSMTGHERIVATTFSLISLMNVGLNALLILRYGLEGAAIASAVSLIAAKLVLSAYAIKKAGLHTTVLGAFFSGKLLRVEASP